MDFQPLMTGLVGERPPVVDDSAATRAADFTGGGGDYTAEGGGGTHGPGAVRLPSLKYHPEGHEQCLRFLQTSDQGTSVRTDGMMSGRRQMFHNKGSTTVWWDVQLGTVPTDF